MKIYAHTLFKNEEKWLWYSVTSIIDYVDKVLLWDTGSTDNSFEIAKKLKLIYKDKIDLRQYGSVTSETFYKARQSMLDETDSDWFIVVDADEIWWNKSIEFLVNSIKNFDKTVESIVVPTINLIGDMYHYQSSESGNYRFGDLVGHYNLRAVNRHIDGLHSLGRHGVWGWADKNGKQIQDRNTYQFLDAPYLHATFMPRGEKREDDAIVPKRYNKLKYEIGNSFPLDYYYPESLFDNIPGFIISPWKVMSIQYRLRALIETPLKKIKRKFFNEKVGY